jgi:hypothetical protein
MKRRQALGAIGAILAAAAAPALIPKSRLMPVKLIRDVTDAEINQYAGPTVFDRLKKEYADSHAAPMYNGWKFKYTKDGRYYYEPTHPTLKARGDLGVAPTPAEMDMLNMDPAFARPVFVPKEKQIVDHSAPPGNLSFKQIEEQTRKEIEEAYALDNDMYIRTTHKHTLTREEARRYLDGKFWPHFADVKGSVDNG